MSKKTNFPRGMCFDQKFRRGYAYYTFKEQRKLVHVRI